MSKKTYVVTEKAGPRVAGQVVSKGKKLELTDTQAAYELQLGTIVLETDVTVSDEADPVIDPVTEPAEMDPITDPVSEADVSEPSNRRSKRS